MLLLPREKDTDANKITSVQDRSKHRHLEVVIVESSYQSSGCKEKFVTGIDERLIATVLEIFLRNLKS